jgi:quercetin dioxygenase-like cupin family protein
MKQIKIIYTIIIGALLLLTTSSTFAQDPVKVEPKHYKVEFENDQVRVLRINYGAGEKSIMHEHPNAVAIFLTDGQNQITLPDGKTNMTDFKSGSVKFTPKEKHIVKNTGKKAYEIILVELKTQKK